jgi:hypothetical protein
MTYAEDGSGVSVANTDGKNAILFGNGIGMGPLPYGDLHTALGALPAFIHPAPRTAVVIGLGSGDTLHAVAGRRDLRRITCVEIIRGELAALAALRMRLPYEGLTDLLDDSRIDQVFGDGRIFLRRGGATTSSRPMRSGRAARIQGRSTRIRISACSAITSPPTAWRPRGRRRNACTTRSSDRFPTSSPCPAF